VSLSAPAAGRALLERLLEAAERRPGAAVTLPLTRRRE
jgi:hypothetical protein